MLNYWYKKFTPFVAGILVCGAMIIVSGCADDEPETSGATQTQPEPTPATQTTSATADSARVADSLARVAESLKAQQTAKASSAEASKPQNAMPKHERLTPEYGVYTVQIGSYDSREAATPFLNKLSADGLDPYIIDEMVSTGGSENLVYRLRFGKYETKDEAHNRGSEVALKYELDYWVDNYRH